MDVKKSEPMTSALSYVRLFSDAAGESHFEPLEIGMRTRNFAPPAPSFDVSELTPASHCRFLRVPKRWTGELHPSPMRMWIFFLSGEMDIGVQPDALEFFCQIIGPGCRITGTGGCVDDDGNEIWQWHLGKPMSIKLRKDDAFPKAMARLAPGYARLGRGAPAHCRLPVLEAAPAVFRGRDFSPLPRTRPIAKEKAMAACGRNPSPVFFLASA
jgi:hypothetical protein